MSIQILQPSNAALGYSLVAILATGVAGFTGWQLSEKEIEIVNLKAELAGFNDKFSEVAVQLKTVPEALLICALFIFYFQLNMMYYSL
jgi:hypothetical protein